MKTSYLLAAIPLLLVIPATAQVPAPDTPRITVTGEATVNVEPDKILINLGIETWDMEILPAKQKNNDILTRAIAAVKSVGVKEDGIQTDQLALEPRWRDDNRNSRQNPDGFLGYFVRNTLVVTLTDMSKVESLVTKVLEVGVNYINGINFQTTDFKKHREAARELALKAAKEKAEKMAAVLGETLGGVLEIHDHGGGSPWYSSSWGGFGGGGRGYAMSQNAIVDAGGGGGENSETIALGKIAITASVSVIFELKR